jgi:tRNA(His) 5'-end guanylyltransferase
MVSADEMGKAHREREWFHGLRVPPGAWTVVRVDGRGFSRLTEERFAKPFDEAMNAHMVAAARALLDDLQGAFACTHSDEISVALPPSFTGFGRGVEKLVSLTAGLASAVFTAESGAVATFDSRLWIGTSADDVVDYFSWRQADAARSALNMWCYWTLRNAGSSAREATAVLDRSGAGAKNELLYGHGVNFNETPSWQRRGTALWWRRYEKEAADPRTGEPVRVTRRRLHTEPNLPMKADYRTLVRGLLPT